LNTLNSCGWAYGSTFIPLPPHSVGAIECWIIEPGFEKINVPIPFSSKIIETIIKAPMWGGSVDLIVQESNIKSLMRMPSLIFVLRTVIVRHPHVYSRSMWLQIFEAFCNALVLERAVLSKFLVFRARHLSIENGGGLKSVGNAYSNAGMSL
jgi:hypothetical protein